MKHFVYTRYTQSITLGVQSPLFLVGFSFSSSRHELIILSLKVSTCCFKTKKLLYNKKIKIKKILEKISFGYEEKLEPQFTRHFFHQKYRHHSSTFLGVVVPV